MTQPPWKVGELARRTGLSVRALHHYDEIGLLQPALRRTSGHRLYDRGDIERLQQIQSLRLLGFPLDEIRRLLEDRGLSPHQIVQHQLARLHEQIAAQHRLAGRLTALATHLESAESVSAQELCQVIEEMNIMEKYFTPEQLAEIRARGETIGQARMEQVGREWAEIIPAVRTAMQAGTDPASPEVQALARRWKGLVHDFTGGNREISKGLERMYANEGPILKEKLGNVPDPEMFAYISKAFAVMK
jgi:DNA-binding transcriptional MerR regulator